MNKFHSFSARIGRLRNERGATDPILAIATMAVTLVLLVGGSFAITGMITNGQNLNAKSDLDKITVSQAAAFAEVDKFLEYNVTAAGVESGSNPLLSDTSVGFNATEGGAIEVVTAEDDTVWRAASQSVSGAIYLKTSESNKIVTYSSAISVADLGKLDMTQADAKNLTDGLN
jgi:hypothetical protein